MPEQKHLKPCPFCGSVDLELDNLTDHDTFFVSCNECDVQQIASYTKSVAIRRWNRRAGVDSFGVMEAYFPFDHFTIGKGRVSEAEPLYGATVYDADSQGQTIRAEGEADTIAEAVENCMKNYTRENQ